MEMKKLILVTIGLILFQTVYSQNATRINWNEDLDFLAKELPEKHFNLFSLRSEKEFSEGINAIKSVGKELTDFQMALKIQQLIASFGDSHTRLGYNLLMNNNKMLPLGLLWLKDGLYVVQTDKSYKEVLGCRLTAINDVPMETIIDSLSTLCTIDNGAIPKVQIPSNLTSAEILAFFGFVPEGQIKLSLKNATGQDISCKMEAGPIVKRNLISYGPEDYSFCFRNRKLLFTDFYNPDDQIYYLQYNQCYSREVAMEYGNKEHAAVLPSFKEFEKKVFEELNNKSVSKIIFDLRYNGGGSSQQGTEFVEKLSVFLNEHPQIRTYVVLGRYTFSSAILNAMDFKRMTNAIFVGEETAGKPNHFGEVRSFQLPNSGLQVNYSTNYFKTSEEDVKSLVPDVELEESFADFAKGIDPVYEWVKNNSGYAIGGKRANGWYRVVSGQTDSLSVVPIVTVADFEEVRLDSTESIMEAGGTVYQIAGKVKEASVKAWSDATEQSIGKYIAFVYNNKVITNPMVNARIKSGNFAISSRDGAEIRALYKDILEEMRNAEISAENKKAWAEARKLRASITDTTFLKTKRPMSDDAIGPYNYHTGLVEDRAYNQTVYLMAIDRAKKHFSVKKNRLVLNIKSGAEINIAEDLFQYITKLFKDWNKGIKEGKYKIIKIETGGYDIEIIPREKE